MKWRFHQLLWGFSYQIKPKLYTYQVPFTLVPRVTSNLEQHPRFQKKTNKHQFSSKFSLQKTCKLNIFHDLGHVQVEKIPTKTIYKWTTFTKQTKKTPPLNKKKHVSFFQILDCFCLAPTKHHLQPTVNRPSSVIVSLLVSRAGRMAERGLGGGWFTGEVFSEIFFFKRKHPKHSSKNGWFSGDLYWFSDLVMIYFWTSTWTNAR